MGYRSDVVLCLTKKGMDKLTVALKQAEKDTPDHILNIKRLFGTPDRVDEASGAVAYIWDCVKWREDYAWVIFAEDFMCDLESEDYYFLRVGEDDDDVDIRGRFYSNPFNARLKKSIVIN